MSRWLRVPICLLVAVSMPLTALADLYTADEAYQRQDFARSFELYRELAELGRREAQENLAVMYVNGEGVKRDNVMGYAWAVIAQENGGSAAMQNIVTQLEPHMTAAARTRVAEVRAQFGIAALQERLLPAPDSPGSPAPANDCKIQSPANPDNYFPEEVVFTDGSVDLEVDVAPDGRARNAKVLYSLPAKLFDEAGQRVALDSAFTAPTVDGRTIACRTRFRVKFTSPGILISGGVADSPEQKKERAEIRAKAASGDPRSQLTYGLILDTRSGLNIDDESASDWFLKAAQAGIPTAQYLVGRQLLASAAAPKNAVDKGLIWLQRAADGRQSDAQAALANYLLRTSPDAASVGKAKMLLEKSAAAGNRDGKYNLAALLATAPEAANRDPQRALALINEVMWNFRLFPASFEIRAAAQAMLGDFAGAQENQTKALKMARKLAWDTKGQETRLASYAASKSWTGDLLAY